MTLVKICCIASLEEAAAALRAGARALGLVSEMPSGPGVIDEGSIAAVVAGVPPGTDTFLLTARTTAPEIVAQHERTRASTLQLVDAVPEDECAELRRRLPGVRLVQVIHVRGPESLDEALGAESRVDALLLDSGNPSAEVKELGGTGRTHDWRVSRRIVAEASVPVYLAGGLDASNVRAAIETVGPYGVDLCTGVRTRGALDPDKLARFMDEVRRADRDASPREG